MNPDYYNAQTNQFDIPVSPPISGSIRALDAVGNASSPIDFAIEVDGERPPSPQLETSRKVVGPKTISESLSGTIQSAAEVSRVEVFLDGQWTTDGIVYMPGDSEFTVTEIPVPCNGQVRTVDKVGNTSEPVSFSIEIDSAAPTAPSIASPNREVEPGTSEITFQGTILSPQDTQQILYRETGGSWKVLNTYTPKDTSFNLPAPVPFNGEVITVDKVGNRSEAVRVSVKVKEVVNEAPKISNVEISPNPALSDDITKISFDLTDVNKDEMNWTVKLKNGLNGRLVYNGKPCENNECTGTTTGGKIEITFETGSPTDAQIEITAVDKKGIETKKTEIIGEN